MTLVADLAKNIAVLLALAMVYSLIFRRWRRDTRAGRVLAGLAFGAAAIIGMMTSVTLRPGLIFDGRSILLSIAGLFGGPIPAAIAALLAGAYRLALGGTGTLTGMGVIVTSAALGAGYHCWLSRRQVRSIKISDLLVLGYAVHIAMLLWMLTLPSSVRWETLQAIAIPVLTIYPAGEVVVGLLLKAEDARQQAEEALRKNEALLEKSQALAHVGSWEVEIRTGRLTWSDEAYRMFGLQPQEFGATYEAFLDAVHPDDRAAVDAAHSGSLREGRDTYEIQHRIIRRDSGEVRVVYEKCEHLKDASGRIVRSIGMIQDVTERVQAEEELQKYRQHLEQLVAERTRSLALSESRYRQFVESPLVGIYQTNTEGRFTFVNQRLAEMAGYSPEDAPAMFLMDVVAPEQRQWLAERMRKRAAGDMGPDMVEAEIVRKDGTRFTCLIAPAAFFDQEGNFAGYIGAMIDITERKRLEEEQRRLLNLMAGREVRMGELKDVIRQLRAQLQDAGMTPVADDPLRGDALAQHEE